MRCALALLGLIGACAAQVVVPARAGFFYYGFGEIWVGGYPVNGTGPLAEGSPVATGEGRMELLLGSGAVLWLDRHSEIRLDATALDDVRVTLVRGSAMVEIVKLPEGARIAVAQAARTETPSKNGLYSFGEEAPAEFRRWAAFRSFLLCVERGFNPDNWQVDRLTNIAKHKAFAHQFPRSSPHLFYAIDYRAGLVTFHNAEERGTPYYLDRYRPMQTDRGTAEVFLGRGITVRLWRDSSMRLLNEDPARPQVSIDSGVAMVEVAEVARGTPLKVHVGDTVIEPRRNGVYVIDAEAGALLVYEGEARVGEVAVRGSQRLSLKGAAKPARFDTKQRDAFFQWCAQRSLLLYAPGGGLMGDWQPLINGFLGHKLFGAHPGYAARQGAPNLEAVFRQILARTPF